MNQQSNTMNPMKRGNAVTKETGNRKQSFDKSWQAERIINSMNNGVCTFQFKKKDGTIRSAKGTLKDVNIEVKGTGRPTPDANVLFFDVEAQGLRSFKVSNLI